MKRLLLTIIVGLVAIPVVGQTNSWKGLTPLRSTREQVEKLFGKPNPEAIKYANEYKVGEDFVQVEYSQKPCDEGWNVPVGSVLSFDVIVSPLTYKSATELKLDEKKFFISGDDAVFGTWTEPILGIQYYFRNMRMSLEHIRYIPRREDNDLRCDGFPPYTPEAQYFTMDTGLLHNPKRSKTEDKFFPVAQLDNAFIHIRNDPEYRLYVLIYFDDKLTLKEYRRRVDFLKSWMYVRRKATLEEIIFLEGGMREENSMELHVIPKDRKPPAAEPTLPSPQFMRPKLMKSATFPKR